MNTLVHFLFSLSLFLFLQPAFAQLNEGFEGDFPPAGWATFNNGVGTNYDWEQEDFNPRSGSNHAYVRWENVTSGIATDWLVTPILLPTTGSNTLTFYAAKNLDEVSNSIYTVRVSTTSQTETAGFEVIEQLDDEDLIAGTYTQFTVDLSAYDDTEIYVAFVMENDNGNGFLLDDIGGPAIISASELPNCDAALTSPANNGIKIPINANLNWSVATGDPTGYKLQIGTASGGSEFLIQTDVGAVTSYQPMNNFAYSTDYYVTITPYNGAGDATGCQEFTFRTLTDPSFKVYCGGAPVVRTLCYKNNEVREFRVESNSDEAKLVFNAGTLEVNADELYIYDGADDRGTLLNSDCLYGIDGDLTGLTYFSTTGSLFVRLTSDINNACNSGDLPQTQIQYTASCVTCTPALATTEVVSCVGNQFYVNVDITSMGSASSVTISNDQNAGTQTANATGIINVGPFMTGSVTLTLENDSSSDCNLPLKPITVAGCLPANDKCDNATTLMQSSDSNCNNAESGTTRYATASTTEGICTAGNLDVWYAFAPASSDSYVFQLVNQNGFTRVAVYSGDCMNGVTLLQEACNQDGNVVIDLVQGTTYYIQIYSVSHDQTGNFDLCVFATPPVPANDLCGNAIQISCPTGGTYMNQDATYATASDAAVCSSDPIGKGIWYQLTGNGDALDIMVEPTEWDAEIQVWSGANCQSLTCMTAKDAGTTGGMEEITSLLTTNGTNYYIYVGTHSAQGMGGMFDLTVSCTQVLAAELLAFDGYNNGKTNVLRWSIGEARNMLNYVIERSTDGLSKWEIIGTVKAKNQGDIQYQLEDLNPLETSYYRLKMVELDGRFTLSDLVVVEAIQNTKLQVVPNPSLERVQIKFNANEEDNAQLELYNLTGKLVRELEVTTVIGMNEQLLSLADLESGFYLLTVHTKNRSESIRLIKK
ncbi:MAG: choice-of-anchor J domain-containing protein [Saprospiraceae bacterium]